MPSTDPCNRWIFREGRHSTPGEHVRNGLVAALARLRQPTRDRLVDALIRAGELETALSDAGSDQVRTVAEITNRVASALVGLQPPSTKDELIDVAKRVAIPTLIDVSVPEGFAYYALHPLAYADMVDTMGLKAAHAAVIGIRSIGSTLSAVVAAACARNHIRAGRITARPTGHPYDRKTRFTAGELRWIAEARQHDAEFLVVDEGPGLSGSSFLSVGEALLAAGVERRRIRFLCSHEPYADTLVAPRGAERWREFQCHWAGMHRPTHDGLINISAGRWREVLSTTGVGIPSWIQMERAKFLSKDRQRLYKFAGLGRYGEEIGRRAELLAARRYAPNCFGVQDGYAEYEVLSGPPMRRRDLSRAVIERIANYCAMRAAEFAVTQADISPLRVMTRYNYEQEFGETAPAWPELEAPKQVVLCDGCMQPHEWVSAADGRIFKTDGETHGDDHFLPGPTDIAWDLAGAMVEWLMPRDAEDALLVHFFTRTGDDASARIDAYVFAYAACRIGFCRMGAAALAGSEEAQRLTGAAERYRRFTLRRRSKPRTAHQSSPRAANSCLA